MRDTSGAYEMRSGSQRTTSSLQNVRREGSAKRVSWGTTQFSDFELSEARRFDNENDEIPKGRNVSSFYNQAVVRGIGDKDITPLLRSQSSRTKASSRSSTRRSHRYSGFFDIRKAYALDDEILDSYHDETFDTFSNRASTCSPSNSPRRRDRDEEFIYETVPVKRTQSKRTSKDARAKSRQPGPGSNPRPDTKPGYGTDVNTSTSNFLPVEIAGTATASATLLFVSPSPSPRRQDGARRGRAAPRGGPAAPPRPSRPPTSAAAAKAPLLLPPPVQARHSGCFGFMFWGRASEMKRLA
jgi:hypothetical protein